MPSPLEELRSWLIAELPKWLREPSELRYLLEGRGIAARGNKLT